MKVMMFFIDGLGLGDDDPDRNPPHDRGDAGLPVAVGRKAAWQGRCPSGGPTWRRCPPTQPGRSRPAPERDGADRHLHRAERGTGDRAALNAYPTPSLKAILNEHSIFKRVVERGLRQFPLEQFGPEFFVWVAAGSPSTGPALPALGVDRRGPGRRASRCSGISTSCGGGRRSALTSTTTSSGSWAMTWIRSTPPRPAGGRPGWLPSTTSPSTSTSSPTRPATPATWRRPGGCWSGSTAFSGGLLEALPADHLLVITSDHGNIEDLSVKQHTQPRGHHFVRGPGRRRCGRAHPVAAGHRPGDPGRGGVALTGLRAEGAGTIRALRLNLWAGLFALLIMRGARTQHRYGRTHAANPGVRQHKGDAGGADRDVAGAGGRGVSSPGDRLPGGAAPAGRDQRGAAALRGWPRDPAGRPARPPRGRAARGPRGRAGARRPAGRGGHRGQQPPAEAVPGGAGGPAHSDCALGMLGTFHHLEAEIRQAVDEHGEVRDDVSPALAEIRRSMRTCRTA